MRVENGRVDGGPNIYSARDFSGGNSRNVSSILHFGLFEMTTTTYDEIPIFGLPDTVVNGFIGIFYVFS